MGEVLKIFETLEGVLGKEKALKVAEAIEKLVEERRETLKVELKEELTKELATKHDLKIVEQSLRALIEQCRGELQREIEEVKGELKAEIEQVKGELKAEIEQVKGELKAEIEQVRGEIQKVKNDLLKWLIVLFIGQATFIVGLVFTLIKAIKG